MLILLLFNKANKNLNSQVTKLDIKGKGLKLKTVLKTADQTSCLKYRYNTIWTKKQALASKKYREKLHLK